MTTTTFGGLRPAPTTRPAQGSVTASGLLARVTAAWTAWHAERALTALDDEALRDIGLDRASIARAVRTGKRT